MKTFLLCFVLCLSFLIAPLTSVKADNFASNIHVSVAIDPAPPLTINTSAHFSVTVSNTSASQEYTLYYVALYLFDPDSFTYVLLKNQYVYIEPGQTITFGVDFTPSMAGTWSLYGTARWKEKIGTPPVTQSVPFDVN